jgi:Flp pilus assembly protein TadB
MRRYGVAVGSGAISAALTWLLIGGWLGAAAGATVGVAGAVWLARSREARESKDSARVRADLPFALDLLAAGLRTGASTPRVLEVVARETRGPLGDGLQDISRMLSAGVPVPRAFELLDRYPDGARLARAAARSADSGASLAAACTRVADDLRAARTGLVEASAARAAVWLVLPLGLCFLPAFVLAGVVPVVMSVLGGVLR